MSRGITALFLCKKQNQTNKTTNLHKQAKQTTTTTNNNLAKNKTKPKKPQPTKKAPTYSTCLFTSKHFWSTMAMFSLLYNIVTKQAGVPA